MAYIDKELLLKDIYKNVRFSVKSGFISPELRGARKVIDRIENALTTDVVEVKHGEWIVKKGQSYLVHPMKYDENGEPVLQDYISYECPFCGRHFSKKEPYCNCGAKMDGQKRTEMHEKRTRALKNDFKE